MRLEELELSPLMIGEALPRYFFDTHDGDVLTTDEVGLEFADAKAARKHAISLLPDMAVEKLPDGDQRIFEVKARTAEGEIVYEADLTFNGRWPTP